MITQRYGNNIPLRIIIAPAIASSVSPVGLTNRKVDVKVIRQQGRTVPFSFTTDGNTIIGTIFGKDQPNREDVLSLRITIDANTESQHIIDIPNIVRLVSQSQQATLTATQLIQITASSTSCTIIPAEQPRPRRATVPAVSPVGNTPVPSASPEGSSLPTHETMAEGATPDVILS